MKYQFTNRVGYMTLEEMKIELAPDLEGLTCLVCGGRDFKVNRQIWITLNAVKPSLVIQGECVGPDLMSKKWAEFKGVHCAGVKANWDAHGKAAGPLRNAAMLLLKPDYVIAFPGGPGTENMMKLAKKAKVPVLRCIE